MQGSLGAVVASLVSSAFVCWVVHGRSRRDVRACPHHNVQPCAPSLGRRAFCCTIRVGSKTASKDRNAPVEAPVCFWRRNAGANGRRRRLPPTVARYSIRDGTMAQSARNTAAQRFGILEWRPGRVGELTAVSAQRHDAVWGCSLASARVTIDEF
jgi:hypothetical protein